MSRAPRTLAALGAGSVVVLALLGSACSSGGNGADAPDITLPSSIDVTTDPDATVATAPSSTTSTSTTVVLVPRAPVIESVRAEIGAAGCIAGTVPVVVTFSVGPEPPVRVFSVFLDGSPAGSSTAPEPITIPAVPCDGRIHSVLFIAAAGADSTATQAVAFRSPGPA